MKKRLRIFILALGVLIIVVSIFVGYVIKNGIGINQRDQIYIYVR